jgi:hypothetical protein
MSSVNRHDTQDIISAVNLQHDCHRGACGTTGTQALYEEREITTLSRTVVAHTDSEHYIVNTASLHNYAQIASALPSHLRTFSFHVESETTLRNDAALQIRLAKQKPPPDAAGCDPTRLSSATELEVPLTSPGDGSTATPHNRDDQPMANHEREAPPSMPLFSHRPKDRPQKGKAKQSTQAMYAEKTCPHNYVYHFTNNILSSEACTVDVLKYFCALYSLSKAGKKADLVDRLMEDIQSSDVQGRAGLKSPGLGLGFRGLGLA